MEIYKNFSGKSGIVAYKLGDTCIEVEFSDRSAYLYNNERPGSSNVEQMKKLAQAGEGLNSFIKKNIKKNYAKRLR